MLSLVVNDALEGADITRRYPTFYRRMLANPELRWAFLEALEILGNGEAGELDPLPDDLDIDLSFLERAQSPPVLMKTTPDGSWSLAWHRPVTFLQSLLANSLSAPRPVYRALANFLEDDCLTLVDDIVNVADDEVGVLLEAVRPAGAPNDLRLSLLVTAETAETVRATVEWGAFHESAVVNAFGQVTFPRLPLATVFDEVGQKMAAALSLTLEPVAP